MKKTIVIVRLVLIVFVVWLVAGIMARRSVMSLVSKNDSGFVANGIRSDDFVFGMCFHSDAHNSARTITWLSEAENAEMRILLKKAKFDHCLSSDVYFMAPGSMDGVFYIVPQWVHVLGLKTILLPLLERISMFYWPSQRLLYLSQDIEDLGYDFTRGLNVSNVNPSCLHLMDGD